MSRAINLCEYLRVSSRAFGERLAVTDSYGFTLTYAELEDQSNRVAGFLAAAGVQPGDRVGVIGRKSTAVVTTLFGVMKAGAAYVPADYTAPAARNRTILSDCNVKATFLDASCAETLSEWPLGSPPSVVWLPDGVGERRAPGTPWADAVAHAPLAPPPHASPDDLAYVLYTSGSTGVPKGVAITHGNAVSFVDWCSGEFAPTEADRFSSHAPFHFDLSILDVYVSLKHGASLFLVSEEAGKNPQELAAFIARHRLTVWYSTPSILTLLAQFGALERHDCSSLRLALFAGEVFPVKHLRSIVERWPHAVFYNLYGPTETNVCTFARIPRTIPPERTEPYPIGHLCAHCDGLVLDAPAGQEVVPGHEGLLHIAGASLFQGYWNRPETAQFFEHTGQRWYNTGDVVRETLDGYVYLGRRDRMVKRRGYRIELGEIEGGLYRHAHVREAAVIAVPDLSSGVRIVAYVSPQPGQRPSVIELKTFCGSVLPAYMNPDAFVLVDAIPRTSTDKVDYQAILSLQQGLAQPT